MFKKTFINKFHVSFVIMIMFVCVFGYTTSNMAIAESNRPIQIESLGIQVIPPGNTDTNQDQQIYASSILSSKKSYTAGEDIKYMFKLYNATPFDVTALKYKVIISDAYRNDRVFLYEIKGTVALKAGETVKVMDTIKAPASLLQDQIKIRIVPVISSAITYSYEDSDPITINGTSPALEMGSWALITDTGDAYPFQAGPSLYQNASPTSATIDVWLKPIAEKVSVKYNIKVFKRGVGLGEMVFSSSSNFNAISSLDKKNSDPGGLDISISIPVFDYTPDVYEAYIEFVDEQNVIRAPLIIARYIVQGDIAAIQFVRPDKDFVRKGETFNLISSITGRPADIFTNNGTNENQEVQITARILNEKNQIVGSVDKTISLTTDYYDEAPITALVSAKAMSVNMIVSKDGKILAEWINPMVATYDEVKNTYLDQRKKYTGYAGIAIFLILLLGILFVLISKRRNKITSVPTLLLMFVLIGFGSLFTIPKMTHADDHILGGPQVGITLPTTNQIMLPGQKFTPRATVYYKACANWGYSTHLRFINNGIPLGFGDIIASAGVTRAICSAGTNKGNSCDTVKKHSSDCPGLRGKGLQRCGFVDHSPVGPNGEEYTSSLETSAPLIPGTYTITATATGRGVSCGVENCETITTASRQYIVQDDTIDIDKENDDPTCVIGKKYCRATAECIPIEDKSCPTCVTGQKYCIATAGCIPNEVVCDDSQCTGKQYCNFVKSCIPIEDVCETSCLMPTVLIGSPPLTNGLCKLGYSYLPPTLVGRVDLNAWSWVCKKNTNPELASESCIAYCPTGSFFDIKTNSCQTQTDIYDFCQNIPGVQTDFSKYTRNQAGQCIANASIKYFKFTPNIAKESCLANWDTESTPGFSFQCKINEKTVGVSQVYNRVPEERFPAGNTYTLSCDLMDTTSGSLIYSVERTAKCFKVGEVLEN